jgi:predicted alpha/beta-hydrolase family hydrolase
MSDPIEIETPHGPARAFVQQADDPIGALVLGHGAGGGVSAPDIVSASKTALENDISVALIEQPYRVAGRKSAAPAKQLDAAWEAVMEHLIGGPLADMPIVTGGRSSGARVACRTAAATGAVGVLCLAFPLHPPGKKDDPSKSRQPELDATEVPVLIIQGKGDPFGSPQPKGKVKVVYLEGDHGLKKEHAKLRQTVEDWLPKVLRSS